MSGRDPSEFRARLDGGAIGGVGEEAHRRPDQVEVHPYELGPVAGIGWSQQMGQLVEQDVLSR